MDFIVGWEVRRTLQACEVGELSCEVRVACAQMAPVHALTDVVGQLPAVDLKLI